MKIKLSDYKTKKVEVVDSLTGFKGVITGHADYITGCDQYLVQPASKDGDWKEGRWFDQMRLEVVTTDAVAVELVDENELTGADSPAPIK
jgi:hypothetical protein